MEPKLENMDVNGLANEIAIYIDRFNFWFDTKETNVEKTLKAFFAQRLGMRKKTLVYQKALRDASITKFQETLLRHFRPVQFELVEWAKFHTLV